MHSDTETDVITKYSIYKYNKPSKLDKILKTIDLLFAIIKTCSALTVEPFSIWGGNTLVDTSLKTKYHTDQIFTHQSTSKETGSHRHVWH